MMEANGLHAKKEVSNPDIFIQKKCVSLNCNNFNRLTVTQK